MKTCLYLNKIIIFVEIINQSDILIVIKFVIYSQGDKMNNSLLVYFIKLKKAGISIIAITVCMLLCVSCRLDIPARQMVLARSSITRAGEVKAEKYAPEELKKAKEELIRSHDGMKSDDVKLAKKSAEESLKYSSEAITKSLPLLAEDTLNAARAAQEEADLAFAEKYAAEEYALAAAKISESESLLSETKYWESYLKSQEAINNALSARDKALSNTAALQESIDRISDESKNLEFIGGREFAPDEMKEIDINLEDAAFALERKNVKEASARIADADTALKTAGRKTWQGVATVKIKAAEAAMQNLEKSSYKESFAADIEKANSLIKESKGLYESENYNQSAAKADEALEIMNSIAIAIEKKTEEKRIIREGEEDTRREDTKIDAAITGEASEYTVKYNPNNRDCLWRIAMSLYKDARLWPLIYIANKDSIKDPDLIFPGQKLKIPSIRKTGSQKTEEKPAEAEKVKNEQAVPASDEVKKDDSKSTEGEDFVPKKNNSGDQIKDKSENENLDSSGPDEEIPDSNSNTDEL
jgi:nucleoid-associated protein YgaU